MKHIRTRHWIGLLVTVSLLLALTIPAGARPADTTGPARIDNQAARWLAQAASGETATFLVGLHQDDGIQAQVDQAVNIGDRLTRRALVHDLLSQRALRNEHALRAFLRLNGVDADAIGLQAFKTFNGFSITVDKSVIQALQRWERVATIELDVPIQLDPIVEAEPLAQILALEPNVVQIGADRVWNELGINGTGVVVGGLDTGARYTHEALSANYKCAGGSHTSCWLDAISGVATPYDDHDHGTHTMGTAVGQNGTGVAPGARWIACKAFNSTGNGTQTDILQCFDWFLAPGGSTANAPDVVNNSWGGSGSSTIYQQAVNNWVNAGIYPEFSNGNSGPSCGTVGSPASYTNAVGTGAVNSSDVIASFSSRGPSPFGVIKPDLVAPGVSIRSAGGSSNTEYVTMSGTSMAGPHTTGLVALLLDANPSLTIAQITQNMKSNALPISATGCSSSGVPNNIYGWGRIRAYESVLAALGGPPPTPTPTATPGPGPTTIFFDNFETNQGWTTNPNGTDTATTGQWERGDPQQTSSSGVKQLGTTVSGVNDLVTGRLAGSSAGTYDIDGGVTSIRSPNITLSGFGSYNLSFSYYMAHLNNSSSADFLRVRIVGATTASVFQELGAANDDDAAWATTTVSLNAFAGQTVYILIEAADASTASLVEAAIDDVRVTGQ
jgi:subtilisin family serine protease